MLKRICTILIEILLVINFSGCFKLKLVDSVYNYEDFLKNLVIYKPPAVPDELPDIKTFEPILENLFDFAKPFNGNFTYVTHNSKKLLLNSKGELFESTIDLKDISFKHDKYSYTDNGKIGIKDLSGNIMIKSDYSTYEIIDDTILFTKRDKAYIYKNEKFIAQTEFTTQVGLYDKNAVIKDGRLYDLNFNKLVYNDCDYLSTASDGMILIVSPNNLHGYVSEDFKSFITPQFATANDFINGFAMVTSNDKCSKLIDKNGNVVFAHESIKVQNFYDGYFCFINADRLGVMDKDFNVIIPAQYLGVKMNRVYGKYLIDNIGYSRFFSIITQQYEKTDYMNIEPVNGIFICESLDKSFCLLDENLQTLITDCEEISYTNNILMVKKNNKYSFYKRNQV